MPRLLDKLRGAKESSGSFNDVEPGAYELVITKASHIPSKEYVILNWDVRVGDYKGTYASSQYPPSEYMSYKDKAIGLYKHRTHLLADANPNRLHAITEGGDFVALREAEEDKWDALVGCRFWAVVQRRLYTAGPNSNNPGADRTQMRISAWITQEEYEKGTWKKSLMDDRDDRDKTAVQPAVLEQTVMVPDDYGKSDISVYDSDIPF